MAHVTVERIGDLVTFAGSDSRGRPLELVLDRDEARDLGSALTRKASTEGHDTLDDLVLRCST